VESPHLNTIATSYNKHFAKYNMGKKKVIQLILGVAWKQVYIDYQMHHPNLVFVEKNLKDHLHDSLKELKLKLTMKRDKKKKPHCNMMKW
jgi:hypothetical protein